MDNPWLEWDYANKDPVEVANEKVTHVVAWLNGILKERNCNFYVVLVPSEEGTEVCIEERK